MFAGARFHKCAYTSVLIFFFIVVAVVMKQLPVHAREHLILVLIIKRKKTDNDRITDRIHKKLFNHKICDNDNKLHVIFILIIVSTCTSLL